jgi:two-component system nitrate/nitrite response regulator NarL
MGRAKNVIRVLVADDHPVVRKGFRSCLADRPHLQLVGEAADGEEAARLARELLPDVALVDINMPRMDGLQVTALLRREVPKVKVLVLSGHSGADYVQRIIQAGARGYVLKDSSPEDLVRAIERLHAGDVFFSPQVAQLALRQYVGSGGEPQPCDKLSRREREVLVQIAGGLSNKEIASRLGVGVRTIETHRERIMRKLKIHSVAGLTKFAITRGLISLDESPAT